MFLKSTLTLLLAMMFASVAEAQGQSSCREPTAERMLAIPKSPDGFIFFTEAQGKTISWIVDTGSGRVVLNRTTADLYGFKVPNDKYKAQIFLLGEMINAAIARVPWFDIGPLRGKDVELELLVKDPKSPAPANNLVGMSFLDQFCWYREPGGSLILWK